MADQQRIALRTVIAGAAHGVWTACLVGVAMMLLGLIAREAGMRLYPDYVAFAWGLPLHEVPAYFAQIFAYFRVMVGFFFLTILGQWWLLTVSGAPGILPSMIMEIFMMFTV